MPHDRDLSDPPLLSVQLLDELESCWREQEAEIVEQLRPGLSDAEIDALVEPFGFQLPSEARLWWGWHNGAEHDDPSGRGPQQLGPLIGHPSLAEALEYYRRGRAWLIEDVLPDVDPEEFWPESWLPITAEQEGLAIDTRGPHRARVHLLTNDEPYLDPIAGSVGELVTLWIEAMRSGAWKYDVSDRRWSNDGRRFPVELREHPYIQGWLFH